MYEDIVLNFDWGNIKGWSDTVYIAYQYNIIKAIQGIFFFFGKSNTRIFSERPVPSSCSSIWL